MNDSFFVFSRNNTKRWRNGIEWWSKADPRNQNPWWPVSLKTLNIQTSHLFEHRVTKGLKVVTDPKELKEDRFVFSK